MPVRTKAASTLPRNQRAAMRRLKRHGLGALSARGVGDPLEVGRDGRLRPRIGGALAVDAFGRLVIRTDLGLEQVPGSPVRLKTKVHGAIEHDSKGRMRLKSDTIARLLPEPPLDGDLLLWQSGHLRPYRDGTSGQALRKQADGTWKAQALPSVVTDHGGLTGLADNDHPQYRPHFTIAFHALGHSSANWASMPAADTFLFGNDRHVGQWDLSLYTQARIGVKMEGTAGRAAATLRLVYASAFSATVGDYDDLGASGTVEVGIGAADDLLVGAWTTIHADARDDVVLAVVGAGGDGAVSPSFGNIWAEFRL